jgi:glycosyltransferase involved in cell wall biosynthesis
MENKIILEKLNSPFFSVIIPTYNRANMLSKAIESVISQTFINWELIIVDDGSTDNTRALVNNYCFRDNRIRYIYQENAERSAARNNGIENANGEYICFLDSDDYFSPERLFNVHSNICSNPKFAVYYTEYTQEIKNQLFYEKKKPLTEQKIYDELLFYMLHCQQCIIHKSILEQHQFDVNFSVGEDLELWLRIASNYSFKFIKNEPSIIIVDHPERTVGIGKINTYRKHFDTLSYIQKLDYPINSEIFRKMLHGIQMSILRCHFLDKNKKEFKKTFFKSFSYHRTNCLKEKLFMFYKLYF